MKHVKPILAIGLTIGIVAIICQPLPLNTGAGADGDSKSTQQLVSDTASDITADAVSVCIIDSGCNPDGVPGKNYLTDETTDLTDATGHGTAIYQILSKAAPDAQIYMLKCFENAEELPSTATVIINAIYDAVDVYHADIINMSWTLNTESEELHEALKYAYDKGVVLVAAAGNLSLSTPLGSIVYPAGWDEVIGVAGTDTGEDGEPATSTWYLHSEAVFVSADGNYQEDKGSSYAAPRVSGILANYLSEQKNASPTLEDAKEYLKSIAVDAGDPGYDTTFGWGVVG